MNVNQYAMINLEIIKQITIDTQILPAVKFELLLPHGIPWAEAETICDDFKIAIQEMRKRQEEAIEAQKQAQNAAHTADSEASSSHEKVQPAQLESPTSQTASYYAKAS
jgi:hypothetical protein